MKRMTVVIGGVMSNLVSFFTIKYIHPRRIITNYSHICCVECAGFFVGVVKTSCCQFVGASANHLPCISKVPLYCVGIHCSQIDSLTIFCAELIYGCDMAKQQGLGDWSVHESDCSPDLIAWGGAIRQTGSMFSIFVRQDCLSKLTMETPNLLTKQLNLHCCLDGIVGNLLDCSSHLSVLMHVWLDQLLYFLKSILRHPWWTVNALSTGAADSAASLGSKDKATNRIICPFHKHPNIRQA